MNQAARLAQQGGGLARRAEVSGMANYYKTMHTLPSAQAAQQRLTQAAGAAVHPTTPEALQTQLRARTQARGAQQLAQAMGHAPVPGAANPFRPNIAPPPIFNKAAGGAN